MELTVRQFGDSLGIVLPKELLQIPGVEKGDTIHVLELPNGFLISTANPEMTRLVEIARKGTERYQNALSDLAN